MDTKYWSQSKTVWGASVAALVSALHLFGIETGDLAASVPDEIMSVIGLIGSVVAIYGRIRASKLIAPKLDPTVVRILVALALPLAALTVASGTLALQGCATLVPNADPVVVNAERTTALAKDTFDTLLHVEFDNRAALGQVSPEIHRYAEVVRRNGTNWLQSARVLTQSYKLNRTPENKASLQTAIAVLQTAMTESNKYLAQSSTAQAQTKF